MDRIDIYAAARSRASWTGRLPLSAMPRLCTSLTDGPGDRDALLVYACSGFTDDLGRPAMALRLDAVLPVRCDRCGHKLALPLAAERTFYFVDTQAALAAIPIDDSPEEALLGSSQFDLAGLIEDEAILQLPISPRHAACEATHAVPATSGGTEEVPWLVTRPPCKPRERVGDTAASAVPECAVIQSITAGKSAPAARIAARSITTPPET